MGSRDGDRSIAGVFPELFSLPGFTTITLVTLLSSMAIGWFVCKGFPLSFLRRWEGSSSLEMLLAKGNASERGECRKTCDRIWSHLCVTLTVLPSLSEPQCAPSHGRSCLQVVGRMLGDPGGGLHTGCGRVKNGETSCFSLLPPPLPALLTDLNCTVSPPSDSQNQASPERLCPEA